MKKDLKRLKHKKHSVIDAKDAKYDLLLTLVERQTRFEYLVLISWKSSQAVVGAVMKLLEVSGEDVTYLFKSITTENGTELSDL
ncbi:hypothetical protein CL176_01955 [Suicoccus acidiformans]|uniref:Integrase catalytic domain-containing protein n=1 Tax=Suicoccus acidiformans TaxID=2036206 RepID=A0A347WIH5_9LACT|nr:hypothetical protein [Suicoccus acidiformans]AXY24882.1 hypothetical protein CL176_01955 [Suicoccus acidiformans]